MTAGRDLDLALLRAWPAADERRVGPWLVRLDRGVTRRANAVLPLGKGPAPSDEQLDAWLEEVVSLYRERDLAPWIQVTGASWPSDLEARLRRRGWRVGVDPTVVLAGPLEPAADGVALRVAPQPDPDWIEAWWAVDPRSSASGSDAEGLATLLALFERIESPKAFLSALDDQGRTVATALGVAVARSLVVECLATRPEARRRGLASVLMRRAYAWGLSHGIRRVVLAVFEANAPARAFYARLGLEAAGGYRYATLDPI